jgi:CheY-like chemotaxis protein
VLLSLEPWGEEGYEVVTVANGLEGLETARRDAFDLVITNNCMRGMSGVEVIERLHQVFPALPVLHIDDLSHPSTDEFPEDVQTLYKPFSIAALQDAVRKLLAG